MGVDVNLYAETTCSPERLEQAEEVFFSRNAQADRYEPEGDRGGWLSLSYDADEEWHAPRVTANVQTRYWGIGYERGDWPGIYGSIRLLQALFPEAKVYYGGDHSDHGVECTEDYLAELWAHYLSPAGDAYRNGPPWPAPVPHPAAADPSDGGAL